MVAGAADTHNIQEEGSLRSNVVDPAKCRLVVGRTHRQLAAGHTQLEQPPFRLERGREGSHHLALVFQVAFRREEGVDMAHGGVEAVLDHVVGYNKQRHRLHSSWASDTLPRGQDDELLLLLFHRIQKGQLLLVAAMQPLVRIAGLRGIVPSRGIDEEALTWSVQ